MKKYFDFKPGATIRFLPPTPEQIQKMTEFKMKKFVESKDQQIRCPFQDCLNEIPVQERQNIRTGKMYQWYDIKIKKTIRVYKWD